MEQLVNILRPIPPALKLVEFLEKRFPKKQKIEILEPHDKVLYLEQMQNRLNKK